MFVRAEYQEVKSRLEEPRMFFQVIAGPRQVGKSTLVEQVLDNITLPYSSCSADNELSVTQAWISNVWDAARNEMTVRHEAEHILVIDEVQKVDNWSEVVKKEWDRDTREKRNLKVLTCRCWMNAISSPGYRNIRVIRREDMLRFRNIRCITML